MDYNENKRFEDYSDPGVTNLNGKPYKPEKNQTDYSYHYSGYEGADDNNGYHYGDAYDPNMAQIPRDRKGRPYKNNYVRKMTFSVIEIVMGILALIPDSSICGVMITVFSIMACIFVYRQNRDYKNESWDGFKNHRILSNIFLWLAFICIVGWLIIVAVVVGVMLVSGRYIGGDIPLLNSWHYRYDYVQDDDSDDWSDDYKVPDLTDWSVVNDLGGKTVPEVDGFNSFEINGSTITLPVRLSDFLDEGFDMNDEDLSDTLEANNSYVYTYYDSEGEYMGSVFIYNPTGRDIKVADSIVGGLTMEHFHDYDIEIVGGLTFGSTLEEAADVLGTDVTDIHGDEGYTYCEWQFNQGFSTSIELDFYGDLLDMVRIMDYASLVDY